MTAAFILAKTGRDALYFQHRGLFHLPLAYIAITLLAPMVAMFILELMRRLGPRTARLVAPLLMVAVLLGYFPVASEGGGLLNTLFFMCVPLAWGVLFSLSWLLAADLLETAPPEQLARSYGIIGAASILGGALGGVLARILSQHVDPRHLILSSALGLLASTVVLALTQKAFPPAALAPGRAAAARRSMPRLREYLEMVHGKYSRMLLAVSVVTALAGVLVEFQFYLAAATSGNTGQENARFFANFYLVLNGAALLVQIYLMPRLQKVAGVHGSLLVLPAALLAGAVALVVASTSIIMRSGLRLAEGGLKSSIHRTNWEQAYLPLERTWRAAAKIVIDGMGARLGEGLAGVALLVWLEFVIGPRDLVGQDTSWVSYALLATTLAWVVLTRMLRRSLVPATSTEEGQAGFHASVPLPDS